MRKIFTKVFCTLLLLAAFNQVKAQVFTFSKQSNENIQIKTESYETRSGWHHYDNGIYANGIGGPQSFSWGIMFPASTLNVGQFITKISLYDAVMHDGFIYIYFGGTSKPDICVHRQAYSTLGVQDFVEFELTAPIPIFEGDNIWIVLSTDNGTQYPASISTNSTDKNGRWISLNGTTWEDLTKYNITGTWMLRAYIESNESISELSSSFNIYPNPASDRLFIETENEINEVVVYDVYGRIQQTMVNDQQSLSIDVSNLSNGVYFVKIKSENNEVVKRFIKK